MLHNEQQSSKERRPLQRLHTNESSEADPAHISTSTQHAAPALQPLSRKEPIAQQQAKWVPPAMSETCSIIHKGAQAKEENSSSQFGRNADQRW